MARYGPEHKQATRRRIIDTAGRRFKTDGFDGAGIATLVADAGLTNGAFYGHFSSKDDLIAAVVAEQLARQAEGIEAMPAGLASVRDFIADYLSPAHRDDVSGGCPSAAMLDEVGRRDRATRAAYTAGASRLTSAIARHLSADGTVTEDDARSRAIGVLTLLVGALQSARAVDDAQLSEQILAAARSHALMITAPSPAPLPTTDQESR
jgi:TetR/AcrR family transcriptional repressor of nem operon